MLNLSPAKPELTHRIEPEKLRDSVVGMRSFHLVEILFGFQVSHETIFPARDLSCSEECSVAGCVDVLNCRREEAFLPWPKDARSASQSCGPMLNGRSFNQYQRSLGLEMDRIRLERRVPRDPYFALVDEAKREQIPVGGHTPAIKPEMPD